MKYHHVDDAKLIRLLQGGDEEAFKHTYDIYGTKLFHFVRRLGLPDEDATDVVQETFVRLWEYRWRIDAALSLDAYVFTIARNLVYNQLKRRAVKHRYLLGVLEGDQTVCEIDDRELRTLIDELVEEMPERRKAVFRMSRLEGYLNQRIAEELDISKSTVENHLNKALKHLKERLGQLGYGTAVLWSIYLF